MGTDQAPTSSQSLPERVVIAIAEQRQRSEILTGWVQAGLIAVLALLYVIAPSASSGDAQIELVPTAIALYAAFTLVRLWLAYTGRLKPWMCCVSIVIDMALLTITIWSFHVEYGQPAAFYLKAPTFAYFFIFIALRTLSFSPGYVLLAGLCAAIGWGALLCYALYEPGGMALVTRDYAEYMTAAKILIGGEVDKILSLLLVACLLAIAVTRGQKLVREAAVDHEQNLRLRQEIEARERIEKDLKEAKEIAEAANQTKSDFLANMSHELRTPLNAIIGYSEMLQDVAGDYPEVKDEFVPDLGNINSAGKHLLNLINDILDHAKIEAGKTELYLERFDLAELVQGVQDTITPLVQKNDNQLIVETDPGIGAMHSDVTKLRQILFNLLSNAAKFTKNGTVTFRIQADESKGFRQVRFEVADTGVGMTAEQTAQIFEPFNQADVSTTRQYGGTGLGLAISEKFCKMLGGELMLTSEPGSGTTFWMTLPAEASPADEGGSATSSAAVCGNTPQPGAHQTQKASAAATDDDPDKPSVLVVDDDPATRDLLTRSLEKQGYRVRLATNGMEALTQLRENPPDAMTLDILMPGLDGWSVLNTVKADPLLNNIPVIMLSITDDRRLANALGAADFLTKPIDQATLADTIRKHTERIHNPCVMIVEDDAATRQMVKRGLADLNCRIEEAENGQTALAQLETAEPDIIVLDLMMPELNGFQFLETIKTNNQWRDTPVIVVTAKTLDQDDRNRLAGNVDVIFHKQDDGIDAAINDLNRRLKPRAAG